MMTFKSLFAYAVVFTAIVQVVHGEVSYACYGTRPQCDFYSMQCPQEHVIKLSNLYAGSKDTTIHTICNNSVQQCENSETCCSWKGTAGEIVQKLNVQNTYNTYKNCSGRQNCTAIHAPWQQLQTASNSLPTYSSFVHFEYACEEVSTKVPFCGGPSGSSDFTSDYAEIMFDGSQESFDPSKASKECQCIVTNLLGRQNTVKFTTIDVRLESHNKGENQTSADCSSASLSSYVLSSTCTASENHYEDNFYRRNRQATLTMLSGGQSELSLTNIHQNGSQDSPAMVWISVEAEESNSIKVTCKEVIPAELTTTTTTTTTPKPTTTTTTTTTPKPTTTSTTTTTPKPTTTTTTTTQKPTTTSTTITTPKPTTTTTTTTQKPTTTTTTTTQKPATTTTTTTTPKPTTTTTTTTPKPTTTTTTTTPKPTTTTTTSTTPKPTITSTTTTKKPTTTTTTISTPKPTSTTTTTTPKPTTTAATTPKPRTTTTTSTTPKPTTTTATTPKPTTTTTASTPESTTTTTTSTPKPPTTAAPATTTVYLESTTSISGGFLPREGDGESDSQQHTAVYLAIFIPVVVCLFFITALLLWIYWKRTIPKKKKFHFMKSTPRSEVYNTFSNPMILDDFIKDVHAKPVTPVLSEKPPISTFISVPEPRKRPKSILVSNGSTNKKVKQPEPYIIPVNVRKSESLYTTPRKEPVQNVIHVRLSQGISDRDKPVIITETVEPEVRPMQQGGNQAGEPAMRQSTLRKKADDNDDGAVIIHVDNLSLPPVSARSTKADSSGNTSPASTRSVIGSTPGNLTPERRNSEPALISTDPIFDRHSASAYVLPGSSPEDSSVLFVP